ncbi:P pilus assembly protein, chaperone PapD [Zymobacter palmae]|uniref:P pilus assembly protein, chaperone PapD n=2 Tax=Zymobacter palmae TaxID=33074 RepID=A0A348HBJ0_9GAMM|nr:P pilus assembly protein, chaperone PapD [Zymobacter palmae]
MIGARGGCYQSYLSTLLKISGVFLLLMTRYAEANLVINTTRVIYNGAARDVTVNVTNEGNQPSLMQSWIDNGNPDSIPDEEDVPFSLIPPVARVNGGMSQALKIAWNGDPLPTDRESVFYLNVMDIPPDPTSPDSNYVQFAIRTRIKVFFRPKGLSGRADSAPRQLVWQQVGPAIRLSNPTPFHVSVNQIMDTKGLRPISRDIGMVSPFSAHDFKTEPTVRAVKRDDLQVETINDYGGNTVSVIHAR